MQSEEGGILKGFSESIMKNEGLHVQPLENIGARTRNRTTDTGIFNPLAETLGLIFSPDFMQ
ncbi:hypothetical protein BTJ39_12510 [Izhakiella australiensis]|uniref:Uncharacterized protein n=1 Tax=Izhakiella australiensis TaxID=1926881 RepID=A0A1S8YL57_9GAMM|nr:hypothetical protein BTJ39_12510 [Izhakiella australiensis]